ncbi:MAG: hypothetical protein HC933_06755 [Pleurocapsa sp. SU_196_0]|nr:hypothetical protein [Pleurocapsa sp. SU_196_0]
MDANNADLQVFTEAEVANLTTLAGGALANNERLLAYGYIARGAGNRTITANDNSSDGSVTVAVRVPSSGVGVGADAYGFTMTFLVFKKPTAENAFVQSFEEQAQDTVAGQLPANLAVSAKIRILPGGTQSLPLVRGMRNVRTAGSPSNLVAVLGPWFKTNPNGITNRDNPLEVVFSASMNAPSNTTATVKRFMGVGGAWNSTPSNTAMFTAPSNPVRPFFANETLEYRFRNLTAVDPTLPGFPNLSGRAFVASARGSASGAGNGNFQLGTSLTIASATDVDVFDASNSGSLTVLTGGRRAIGDLDTTVIWIGFPSRAAPTRSKPTTDSVRSPP